MGYQQQSVNYRLCVFFGFQPSLIFILDEKPLANAGRFLLGRDYFGTGGSAVYLFRPTHMYDLGTIGEPSAAAVPMPRSGPARFASCFIIRSAFTQT
jgi:hypothetical protein